MTGTAFAILAMFQNNAKKENYGCFVFLHKVGFWPLFLLSLRRRETMNTWSPAGTLTATHFIFLLFVPVFPLATHFIFLLFLPIFLFFFILVFLLCYTTQAMHAYMLRYIKIKEDKKNIRQKYKKTKGQKDKDKKRD